MRSARRTRVKVVKNKVAPPVPAGRVRHHVQRGHQPRGRPAGRRHRRRACCPRPAPGSTTARPGWARAARTAREFLKAQPGAGRQDRGRDPRQGGDHRRRRRRAIPEAESGRRPRPACPAPPPMRCPLASASRRMPSRRSRSPVRFLGTRPRTRWESSSAARGPPRGRGRRRHPGSAGARSGSWTTTPSPGGGWSSATDTRRAGVGWLEAELRRKRIARPRIMRGGAGRAGPDGEQLPSTEDERARAALDRHLNGRPLPEDRRLSSGSGCSWCDAASTPARRGASFAGAIAESTPGREYCRSQIGSADEGP